jgi:hypothetical protein
VDIPQQLLEEVAELRFPQHSDERLQWLMDRNNEGQLSPAERNELVSYVELSQRLALVRAKALQVLGRQPT